MDTTITLKGESLPVSLPDLVVREELAIASSDAQSRGGLLPLRVSAAAIGLCTPVGRRAKADLARAKYDLLAYGGAVYSWLREQGVTHADLAEQGGVCLRLVLAGLFPREDEVVEAVKNSDGGSGK